MNWYFVAPDGTVTEDLATYQANTCLRGADQIANPIPPDGTTEKGGILLDVPAEHRRLVYYPAEASLEF